VTASELNPRLFVVARQNQAANSALFSAYGADFTVLPSRIVAQECIALLTAPLLARFLERVQQLDETACRELVERLLAACSGQTPVVWDNRLNAAEAPASWQALMHGRTILLGRRWPMPPPVLPCCWSSATATTCCCRPTIYPASRRPTALRQPAGAQRKLELTLRNANELDYVLTGDDHSGSLLGKLLAGARPERQPSRPGSKNFRTAAAILPAEQYNSSLVSKNILLIYLTNT
jgi:hypothetical protein